MPRTAETPEGDCSVEVFDAPVVDDKDGISPVHTQTNILGEDDNAFLLQYAKLMVARGCKELFVDQVFVPGGIKVTVKNAGGTTTYVPATDNPTMLKDANASHENPRGALPNKRGFAFLDMPGFKNLQKGTLLARLNGLESAVKAETGTIVTLRFSFMTLLECRRDKEPPCFFLVEWEAKLELVVGEDPSQTRANRITGTAMARKLDPKKPADAQTIRTIQGTTASYAPESTRMKAAP